MVTISDYYVLTDVTAFPFDQNGATYRMPVQLPTDILTSEARHRPVLCYNVVCDKAEDVKLKVTITENAAEHVISNGEWNGNLTHQVMDPFHETWINGGANTITLERISGKGSVQVRNLVLFVTRRVLT